MTAKKPAAKTSRAAEATFKVGDVVTLKSGGKTMTITRGPARNCAGDMTFDVAYCETDFEKQGDECLKFYSFDMRCLKHATTPDNDIPW